MTSSDTRFDPSPYSARQCKCGSEMQRLAPPAKYAWLCPTCGRQQRQ